MKKFPLVFYFHRYLFLLFGGFLGARIFGIFMYYENHDTVFKSYTLPYGIEGKKINVCFIHYLLLLYFTPFSNYTLEEKKNKIISIVYQSSVIHSSTNFHNN